MSTNVFKQLMPGDKMADFTAKRFTASVLKANGIKGVFAYIDGTAGSSTPSPKCMTKLQLVDWLFGGIAVTPVFEKSAARCLYGHQAGVDDGKAAVSDLAFLGYPNGTNILVAFDTDITLGANGNIAKAFGYWQGFCDAAMAAGFRCSAYADRDFLDFIASSAPAYRGVANVQANARGWSWDWLARKWRGLSTNAHLDQQAQSILLGSAIDIDKVVKPIQVFAGTKP